MNKQLNIIILSIAFTTICLITFVSYKDYVHEKEVFGNYTENLSQNVRQEYKNKLKESVDTVIVFIESSNERIITNHSQIMNIELIKVINDLTEFDTKSIYKYIQQYQHDFIKLSKENPESIVKKSFTVNGIQFYISVPNKRIDSLLISDVRNFLYKEATIDNNYLWIKKIIDFRGGDNYALQLIHPNLKKSEGQLLSTETEGIKGNKPYLEELLGINKDKEIYFEYFLEELTSNKISKKLSYAKLFEKQNWIISTGIPLKYLNNDIQNRLKKMKEEYTRHFSEMILSGFLITILFIIMSLILIHEIHKYFNISQDLKEKLSKKLEETENRASKFFDLSINLLLITDIGGNIIKINSGWKRILGYEEKELLGKSFFTLVHPDDIKKTIHEMEKIHDGNAIDYFENRYRHKNGTFKTLAWTANIDLEKNLIYGSAQDITQTRSLEIEKNIQLVLNEKIYKDLFELNNSIILLIDPKNGDILNANKSALKFYGYEKSKLLSLNISAINNLTKKEIEEKIEIIINETKDNHYFNFVHTLANGEKRNVRAYSNPSMYKNKQVLFSTITDVTEEFKTKHELLNIQKDFKNLFNNAEVSIWNEDFTTLFENLQKLRLNGIEDLEKYLLDNPQFMVDMANSIKVIEVNKATLKMFKAKSTEEFIGSISKTFGANAFEIFKKELLAIWKGDDVFREECDLMTFDGKTLYTIISFPIPKTIEEFRSIPVSILDITQTKQKDTLLFQQSKMASMGEMIGNIAHQWRQPLSVISVAVTGVKFKMEFQDLNNDTLNKSLNQISNSVQNLSQIIDDFRGFFKPNKSKEEFQIKETFEKVFKLLSSQFKIENITIIQNIEEIFTVGFENELIQVLINIINNARDELIKKENKERLILIDGIKNNGNIEITIKDNADGIPEDIINKVFDSHFTTKEDTTGTGIGLYMSKMIIEEHMNGTIEVVNETFIYEGNSYKGACFTIRFPFS